MGSIQLLRARAGPAALRRLRMGLDTQRLLLGHSLLENGRQGFSTWTRSAFWTGIRNRSSRLGWEGFSTSDLLAWGPDHCLLLSHPMHCRRV